MSGTRLTHPTPGPTRPVAPGDLALLRSWCRHGIHVPAAELLGHAGISPRTDVLVGLLLPRAVTFQGRPAATAALVEGLRSAESPEIAASLLDLATLVPGLPTDGPGVLAAHGAASQRRLRHAAWRYASRCPPDKRTDRSLLALAGPATRHQDRLSWTAAARERGIPESEIAAALRHQAATPPNRPAPLGGDPADGLTVVQTALRGPLFRPGTGDSGGLSVFLTGLGNALVRHPGIRRVVTVTLTSETEFGTEAGEPRQLAPGHHVVPVPDFDYGDWGAGSASDPPGAGPTHPALAWWFAHVLTARRIAPDVVHVRFADDASRAVSQSVEQLGTRLVLTLTPDPHRIFFDRQTRHVGGDHERPDTHASDEHRILLADALLDRADSVVALPGQRSSADLARYFPRLTPARGNRHLHLIREGIPPLEPRPDDDRAQKALVAELFAPHPTLPRLDHRAAGDPLLLNVGRISSVKQQDLLVEAWLGSGAHRLTALVLVGGSPEAPTAQERAMLARVRALLADAPEAAGRVALLSALPNHDVRLLEAALERMLPSWLPHLYVCASAKEEFGIAILEAMDAGLLVAGPRRGGVSHYVTPGENGFLIDTSTAATIADGLRGILELDGRQRAALLRSIAQRGQATVRASFGMHGVGDAFADHYIRTCTGPDGGNT